MNLKKTLKKIKLNESTISMVMGAIIIVVVGLLVINFFRKESGVTLPVTETQNLNGASPKVGQVHKIRSGETLWSIAEAAYGSGYNWVDIQRANNIENPGMISEGDSIEIPDVEPKSATKISELIDTTNNVSPITGATYRVVKGDSLWSIAVRAYGDGYKWVEIAKENKLENPNLIHTGNIFTLPR